MALIHHAGRPHAHPPRVRETIPIRHIGTEDLRIALRQGWEDFNAKRGDLIFAGILYPVIGFVVAWAAIRGTALPLIFPLLAGLSIMGPAVASGFYELARRREKGLDSDWRHMFDVRKSPQLPEILFLTAVLAILFAAWIAVAAVIYGATMAPVATSYYGMSEGPTAPSSIAAFLHDLFLTRGGWALIVFGNLAGLGFAIVALMISVISFPMLIDRKVTGGEAMATSVRAVMRNPGAMLRWGLIVAGMLVLGAIPFLIGLAVVLPVLGYATWHLYTRVVER